MSNLSDIGFGVYTEDEFDALSEKVVALSEVIAVDGGSYAAYRDPSGAQMWYQFDHEDGFMGFNPHYAGQSRRTVRLTAVIERPESELDWAYHAWALPEAGATDEADSGLYPFVFDLPSAKLQALPELPTLATIQLSAFAQELSYYASEADFYHAQAVEQLLEEAGEESDANTESAPVRVAANSFIPIGLFLADEELDEDGVPALASFAGTVKAVEQKQNQLTGDVFFWLLVDTLGGPIDVLADPEYFEEAPEVGGIVHGEFWLAGNLL